jgi:hypothetical protein
MGNPLIDIGTTMAYFGGGHWEERNHKIAKVGFLNIYLIAFAYLPFWWRFWQCIKKWKTQGNKMQLVNSCKYASKFGPPTMYYIFGAANKVDLN